MAIYYTIRRWPALHRIENGDVFPMKQFIGVLCVSLMFSVSARANGEKISDRVTSVSFKDVDCTFATCTEKKDHGNLTITYKSGKTVVAVSDGTCAGSHSRGTEARISPDKKYVGLLTGIHFNDSANYYYFGGSKLRLFKDGKCVHTIVAERYFIEEWHFWENGKQLILRSRAKHGVATVERWDVASGRLLEKLWEYKVDAKSPAWARKMAL